MFETWGKMFEVWEKAVGPVSGSMRSVDGKDYCVGTFDTKKQAERHAIDLGGERQGVYVKIRG